MDVSSIMSAFTKLAAILLLVLANGFFVASEFALVGVRRSRVESLAAEGNRSAKRLLSVLDRLDAYISATQLGITVASIALGWIAEATLASMLIPVFQATMPGPASQIAAHSIAIAVAFAIITFLHIVLGELAPKTLALERAETVALAVARPMEIFHRVFKAPIWLLNNSGILVLRVIGLKSSIQHAASYSVDELRHLIGLSHQGGHLIPEEQQLIYNVLDFNEATLGSVMVPRTEIEALDASLSPDEMLKTIEEMGYSRMPVYSDALDNVIGIILHKDISRAMRHEDQVDVRNLMRSPTFLPITMRLNDALRSLRRSSGHMALVVDEHGGVEGLVTLEDLIETIVGDIRDEHDEAIAHQIVQLRDGCYRVSGRLAIKTANRRLSIPIPESDTYHTIAGFMMARAGRLLGPGDSVTYNGHRFTVETGVRNRILEARIEPLAEQSAPLTPLTTAH